MGDKDKKPVKKAMPGWLNFVIGGSSGMLAICIVQPADLVKTRMQLLGPAGKKMSTLAVASDILKREGFLGFYSGLSAALFRQATYTTGRMGCFNSLLDYYKSNYGVPGYPVKIAMGMTSGGIGAFIGTPAEVALIRMTADGRLPPEKRRNYKNVFNALGRLQTDVELLQQLQLFRSFTEHLQIDVDSSDAMGIIREEGITAMWRGAMATVTRAMVVNGAQLSTYAQAREMLLSTLGEGIFLHFCSSMIAGLVTTAASLPVDIVKTRVQNAAKGTSQVGVLMNVIKNEGVLALWSGFLPTYAKIGPHTVLTFIFLEQLNSLYFRMA